MAQRFNYSLESNQEFYNPQLYTKLVELCGIEDEHGTNTQITGGGDLLWFGEVTPNSFYDHQRTFPI